MLILRVTYSSASFGSVPDGHEYSAGDSDAVYSRNDAMNAAASPADVDSRRSLGTPLSRPSSVSTLYASNEVSVASSPPFQQFGSNADVQSLARQAYSRDIHPDRSVSSGGYHGPIGLPSHSSSLGSSVSSSQDTQFSHPRRKPPGAVDHIPTFRHEPSSRSSVMSSQSSISTAATSRSTFRGSEDDGKPPVTLPPLSAVTGLCRDGEYLANPAIGPLAFSTQRPVMPGRSEPSGMFNLLCSLTP